jgi:hypothetical protein
MKNNSWHSLPFPLQIIFLGVLGALIGLTCGLICGFFGNPEPAVKPAIGTNQAPKLIHTLDIIFSDSSPLGGPTIADFLLLIFHGDLRILILTRTKLSRNLRNRMGSCLDPEISCQV